MSDRTRTYSWRDPLAIVERGAGLSGLELLRQLASGELPPPPIAQTLGLGFVSVADGTAVFEVEPAEFHYNLIGVVHGGLALALLDSAMGCAVHSTLPAGVTYTTIELKANFVRPLTAATGRVRCHGSVVHGGRTVATAEGRVEDMSGKLYAHGTSTLLVMPGESA